MRSSLELKAVFTVPELARHAGVTRWAMARQLAAANVPMRRRGRTRVVYFADLRNLDPSLLASIIHVEQIRDVMTP